MLVSLLVFFNELCYLVFMYSNWIMLKVIHFIFKMYSFQLEWFLVFRNYRHTPPLSVCRKEGRGGWRENIKTFFLSGLFLQGTIWLTSCVISHLTPALHYTVWFCQTCRFPFFTSICFLFVYNITSRKWLSLTTVLICITQI